MSAPGPDESPDRTAPVRTVERWTAVAWLPFALLLAGAVYLGMRPGGTLPVQVYQLGPLTLALASLAGLIAAVAWSSVRRPFLRPGRMIGFAGLAFTVLAATVPFSYPSSHARRPSQVEFTFHPGKGLESADMMVLFRSAVKQIARLRSIT